MNNSRQIIFGLIAVLFAPFAGSAEPLIVVEDRGGISALPYYEVLKSESHTDPSPSASSSRSDDHSSEADMLPVHSTYLSPGIEPARAITAPGLTPMFLVGNDEFSRTWLHKYQQHLNKIKALGFVVNVDNEDSLNALRALTPGLTLVPASGNDLAQRLRIRHYPVLITATAIEQ